MRIINKFKKTQEAKSIKYNKLVCQTDAIMDYMLKHLMPVYQATDFSERLRRTGLSTFTHPKLIWEAHTYTATYLRTNQVILTRQQAQNMLDIYYQAFIDLEVM